eukprot:gnl/TRDRNA2_/TRDRNA2_43176_c0_seq1.p1 gnl/TRDRNA2_/TRDRNA2_43176_c0~~gnl/TRDRNA2_/TRDRNA2_43176_c0_seq1.p1  ORF type:complete len:406 (+),score=91.43 gnl/TRDRNA2_/TRDRNA2_43176_c0_seq1:70-1218(+)
MTKHERRAPPSCAFVVALCLAGMAAGEISLQDRRMRGSKATKPLAESGTVGVPAPAYGRPIEDPVDDSAMSLEEKMEAERKARRQAAASAKDASAAAAAAAASSQAAEAVVAATGLGTAAAAQAAAAAAQAAAAAAQAQAQQLDAGAAAAAAAKAIAAAAVAKEASAEAAAAGGGGDVVDSVGDSIVSVSKAVLGIASSGSSGSSGSTPAPRITAVKTHPNNGGSRHPSDGSVLCGNPKCQPPTQPPTTTTFSPVHLATTTATTTSGVDAAPAASTTKLPEVISYETALALDTSIAVSQAKAAAEVVHGTRSASQRNFGAATSSLRRAQQEVAAAESNLYDLKAYRQKGLEAAAAAAAAHVPTVAPSLPRWTTPYNPRTSVR